MKQSSMKEFVLSGITILLAFALLMTLPAVSVNAATLPSMTLTVVGPNGTTQTLNQTTIGSMPTYSGYGGFYKNGAVSNYFNYTGVPLTTLGNLVGGITNNTFVEVLSTVGGLYSYNFSCGQAVSGIMNVTSCADVYNLTTANLLDQKVSQTEPITLMLAYQYANGTLMPSGTGPLYLTFVGPQGLLVVPNPSLSGGKPWVKEVTSVDVWWLGDFYCNHNVNYNDIVYFVDAYIAANSASPVVNKRCDFNLDGKIDYSDVVAFVDCYIAANA